MMNPPSSTRGMNPPLRREEKKYPPASRAATGTSSTHGRGRMSRIRRVYARWVIGVGSTVRVTGAAGGALDVLARARFGRSQREATTGIASHATRYETTRLDAIARD